MHFPLLLRRSGVAVLVQPGFAATCRCREARIRLKNASCKAIRARLVLNREHDGETMRSM